jgi:hypothetical protein
MPLGQPDFVGIGAQKAATTWLFKRLSMHPEIYFPRGKEIHFWDRRDKLNIPINSYKRTFDGVQIEHIGGKTGEITPAYLLLSDKRITELRKLAPDLRLMVILRNPVDRAISAAAQVLRNRGSGLGRANPLFSKNTTSGGLYGQHLGRWLSHFPRNQLHVISHEEIRQDARAVLQKTSEHLEVDPEVYNLIDRTLLESRTSPTPNRLEISPEQRARLAETYRADVEHLQNLLQRDFGWNL